GVNARLNNAVLDRLRTQRLALLRQIGDALQTRPMLSLADCDVSYDALHAGHTTAAGSVANQQVRCPSVRDKLPGAPASALGVVTRALAELDRQISEANQRLVTSPGQGGAILRALNTKRAAVLQRIAAATGLKALPGCTLDADPAPSASPLPDPEGPNLELP